MMKKILSAALGLVIAMGLVATPAVAVYATDDEETPAAIGNNEMNPVCNSSVSAELKEAAGCNITKSAQQVAVTAINVVISVVGVMAVLVIVVAGQRFLVANGDPGKVAQAKNMVLYAVVGLIVAGLAFAIVNFVASAIQNNANMGGEAGGVIVTLPK